MDRPLERARLFTPKQYLAKAVEYGDLAKKSVCRLSSKESYSTMRATWASCWILRL